MKRYVAEPGSDLVRATMRESEGWFMCRVGFAETARAISLAAGEAVVRRFRAEWSAFGVVEVDQGLVERAADLAGDDALRSLDALHLAAALLLPRDELTLATWDRRLHGAAAAHGIPVAPEGLGAPPA